MKSLEPYWIAGFVDGEWTFYVGINKHSEMSAWYQVLPEFRVVQHERDVKLLHKIKQYFGCGVVRRNHDTRYELRIRKREHLTEIIVPFFEQYQLQTQKKHDFIKFKKVLQLMDRETHLTKEWIAEIFAIIRTMNRAQKEKTKAMLKADKDIVHTLSKDNG